MSKAPTDRSDLHRALWGSVSGSGCMELTAYGRAGLGSLDRDSVSERHLSSASDEQVWFYREVSKNRGNGRAVERATACLLTHHEAILGDLAWKEFCKHPNLYDREIYRSEADFGAIVAYDRFDPLRRSVKGREARLSTFVYRTVWGTLKEMIEDSPLIPIPSKQRKFRTWMMGQMTPAEQVEFEALHGLNNGDVAAEVRSVLSPVLSSIESMDAPLDVAGEGRTGSLYEVVPSAVAPSASCLVELAARTQVLAKMTAQQARVLHLTMVEGYTVREAADEMEISSDEVRKELARARRVSAQEASAEARECQRMCV